MSLADQAEQSTETINPAPQTEETQELQTEGLETQQLSDEERQTAINQEAVNKRINAITFEKHEERRKREAAEKRAQEAEQRLAELQQQPNVVEIPDRPEPFDPEYDKKIAAREEAIQKAAVELARKKALEDQVKAQRETAAGERRKAIQTAVETMFTTGETYGIKKEELAAADRRVATFIRDPGLATFIISHKEAPLVVQQLASSADELDKISRMNPYEAAVYISSVVVPKALELKPRGTQTPAPLNIPRGRAAGNQSDPYLKGVTLE